MSGVDNLLSKSAGAAIKDNLGEKTLQKIEKRLFEKYGIPLSQAAEDFPKLDSVLREFFGLAAIALEKTILNNICTLEKSKEMAEEWLTIKDQFLVKVIIEALGNKEKKKILTSMINTPHLAIEILDMCNVSQNNGFKIIDEMIKAGLLIECGFMTTTDGRKISKYIVIFKEVKKDIINNKVVIRVKLCNEALTASNIVPLIRS
ncbi:MAG TPA: transcriptional regulator [Nitrosopumilaceae archaeon]|nr:transcriptional regulator [Nitrosopumilaceae archaeon]